MIRQFIWHTGGRSLWSSTSLRLMAYITPCFSGNDVVGAVIWC